MKENKDLYYEVAVGVVGDVLNAYKEAVDRNAKFYRGVKVGKDKTDYYGWNDGKAVKATDGQEWFENPEYKEPLVATEPGTPLGEPIVEQEVAENIVNTTAIDYEAQIAELKTALAETSASLDAKTVLLEKSETTLAELAKAVKVIVDFIKDV